MRNKQMNKWEEQVREFHKLFGATIGDSNQPSFSDSKLRMNLIEEEFNELKHEVNWANFDKAVHETIDLLYVTIGTLISWGIFNIDDYFNEIHQANLRKLGGTIREDKKIIKPDGFIPADLSPLIHSQKERMNQPSIAHLHDNGEPISHRHETPWMPQVPKEVIEETLKNSTIPVEVNINNEAIVQEVKRGRGRPRKSS